MFRGLPPWSLAILNYTNKCINAKAKRLGFPPLCCGSLPSFQKIPPLFVGSIPTDPCCVRMGKKQPKDGEKMQTTKQLVFFCGGWRKIKSSNPIHQKKNKNRQKEGHEPFKKRINFTKVTVKRLEPLDGFGRCVLFSG